MSAKAERIFNKLVGIETKVGRPSKADTEKKAIGRYQLDVIQNAIRAKAARQAYLDMLEVEDLKKIFKNKIVLDEAFWKKINDPYFANDIQRVFRGHLGRKKFNEEILQQEKKQEEKMKAEIQKVLKKVKK